MSKAEPSQEPDPLTVAVVVHDCGVEQGDDLASLSRRAIALERAGVTAIIVRDTRGDGTKTSDFEPFSLLAALSRVTTSIGLIAATPVSTSQPYPTARRTATLDHLTQGRSGWIPDVTSGGNLAASELIETVTGLWDSTADDAIASDKATGVYLRGDRRRPLDHRGATYQVAGPLNLSRPPQGHPVIIMDDAPRGDRTLAAQYADVITIYARSHNDATERRGGITQAVAATGRSPKEVRVWAAAASNTGAHATDASAATIADTIMWAQIGAIDGVLIDITTGTGDAAVNEVTQALGPNSQPFKSSTLRERLRLQRPLDVFGTTA